MGEKLYSSQEAGKLTDKAAVTVRQLARDHGIGQRIGRDWIFTQEDIDRLKAIPKAGRPPFKSAA